MSPFDPATNGWRALPGAALPAALGVPWAKQDDGKWRYGLQTVTAHANPTGAVHGGILMTFADHGLSLLAWEAADRALCATIQLNSHFLDTVRTGSFLELRGNVTRRTLGLVFVRGIMAAREDDDMRDILAVDGIWRVLRPR